MNMMHVKPPELMLHKCQMLNDAKRFTSWVISRLLAKERFRIPSTMQSNLSMAALPFPSFSRVYFEACFESYMFPRR